MKSVNWTLGINWMNLKYVHENVCECLYEINWKWRRIYIICKSRCMMWIQFMTSVKWMKRMTEGHDATSQQISSNVSKMFNDMFKSII